MFGQAQAILPLFVMIAQSAQGWLTGVEANN